jgi:flavin reductase (DIM6/NTAB) family NADH-FMN oxidoreductase RutF
MSGKLPALFNTLTHGVYVVGIAAGETYNAFTAACIMLASFDPPMLALSINPKHGSWKLLKTGGCFSVNVLRQEQMDLAIHFGKPISANKLESCEWHKSARGLPIIDAAMAWFECEYVDECRSGDHVVIIGKVTDGKLIDASGLPMNYRDTNGIDGSAALFPDNFAESGVDPK